MSDSLKLSRDGRRRVLRNIGLITGAMAVVGGGFIAGRLMDQQNQAEELRLTDTTGENVQEMVAAKDVPEESK